VTRDVQNETDVALFVAGETSLADIKAAGWRPYFSSSGEWWFERTREGGGRDRFLPTWVRQLQSESYKEGADSVRRELRRTMTGT
jgi:hypothetical protein